jgi:hypothetical protein
MKLPKIKTIEGRIWKLCRAITRAKYPNVCVSCGEKDLEGTNWHTGHYFRKKFIPIQMKYDLRLLRPQCRSCNMRKHGALEYYTVYLLKNHPKNYILDIHKDILSYKNKPMNTKETRSFLLDLEQQYVTILGTLPEAV